MTTIVHYSYCLTIHQQCKTPSMMHVCMQSHFSRVRFFATPWTVAHRAPLSMGFSSQEYWSGCHALLQGIFPTQGSNPGLPHCRQSLYQLSHKGSPYITQIYIFQVRLRGVRCLTDMNSYSREVSCISFSSVLCPVWQT